MPINRRYPLKDLLAACRAFPLPRHRRITFAYVLLAGVNDDVPALAALSRALVGCGVLPYYLHQLDRVQGAAHFEVLIPGTTDHQVLSWIVARDLVVGDLMRSGLLLEAVEKKIGKLM